MSVLGNTSKHEAKPMYEGTGDGAATPITLSWEPGVTTSLYIFVGGIAQSPTRFTVLGNILTPLDAIPLNAKILIYGTGTRISILTPAPGSVVSESLSPGGIALPSGSTVPTASSGLQPITYDQFIAAIGGAQTAPGVVAYTTKSTPPTGWLKANGASLSTTTYAALFAEIGYTYGGSGGSFSLPELRGEFIRSLADGRAVDTGRALGSYQADDFASHSHVLSTSQQAGVSSPPYGGSGVVSTSYSTNATGGSETRPRNVALLAIIKY